MTFITHQHYFLFVVARFFVWEFKLFIVLVILVCDKVHLLILGITALQ